MTHPILNDIPDPILNGTSTRVAGTVDNETSEDEKKSFGSKRRIGLAILGMLALGTVAFLGLRSHTAKSDLATRNGKEQIVPVTIATATQRTVPVQISAIGNVQAGATVAVTPQASGRITNVFFQKGQDVRKGQLLFTLDDRAQAAAIAQAQGTVARDLAQVQQARATLARDLGAVRQAQATLVKDQAQAQFAQAQNTRYSSLYKQGAISQDQAQQYTANSKVSAATLQVDRDAISNAEAVVEGDKAAIANAEAVVTSDRAALANVQVQSSYTKIYSPIDGRAGNILVTAGNVVQAGSSNPLVTIAKIHPIQVAFSVPESNLPEIQQHMEQGKLPVSVSFTGSTNSVQGSLTFVNNTVDPNTGTIQLIGDFDNTNNQLFPGQFVNTTLTLTQEPNAIVVPAQAVQNGPDGQFVFVVNRDNTVTNVPVVASSTIDGLDVIQKGLQPGAQVVTDGQANLVAGSKVRVKNGANNSANAPNSDRTQQNYSQPTGG